MATERTFALIKTGVIERGQRVTLFNRITGAGFRVVDSAMFGTEISSADIDLFKALYREHEGKPYYAALMDSVARRSQALILEAPDAVSRWRTMMGLADPAIAYERAPNSLRAMFGTVLPDNAVHGSDSLESAQKEIAIFFPKS